MTVYRLPAAELKGEGMTSQRARDRLAVSLKESGIRDPRVIEVIRDLPRHHFIDQALHSRAYENTALPIGHGQTISQPWVVARMTEVLLEYFDAKQGMPKKVLEIGTGSGYQAAVLSRLAREVVSIERYRTLADAARDRIKTLGFSNVTIMAGDGLAGAPDQAPFDRIIVTAAAQEVPNGLLDQLADGGKMLLPLGPHHGTQHIVKLTKSASGEVERENLIAVRFVPLLPGKAREL